MNFRLWFQDYHKSYDLRCGKTELHLKSAWDQGQKELIEFVDLISADYNRIGTWHFSGKALDNLNAIKKDISST